MRASDEILEEAARDGSIDINDWPHVLESMLQKLHDIVHNAFPVPAVPTLPPFGESDIIASTPPPSYRQDEERGTRDVHADDEMQENYDDENDDENQPPPNSQSSTKENEAPRSDALSPRTPSRPPVPGFKDTSHHLLQPSGTFIEREPGGIPPDLFSLYQATTHVLERDFAQSPPYTIQRLAEMVLQPRKHYRFLPAYLRALDRIVSVSSPLSDFPLPTLNSTINGSSFLTNGDSSLTNGTSDKEGLGSDESLGGALLTPIPWLRNSGGAFAGNGAPSGQHDGELHSKSTETIEGPNGSGSVETVTVVVNGVPSHPSPASNPGSPTLSEQSDASTANSVESTESQLRLQGGVTQGELLRQEQEAGVVPASQPAHRRPIATHSAATVGRESSITTAPAIGAESMDDRPHARGPEEVGMEDTGPQSQSQIAGELNMEAAVGRAKSPPAQRARTSQSDSLVFNTSDDDDDNNDDNNDAGAPGRDPKDVEMEVDRLKEAMDARKEMEAKDADGDVVVADAAGDPVE